MKRILPSLLVILALVTFAAAAEKQKGITPADVAGKPDVTCKVIKEPDPLLMGGWKGIHMRYIPKTAATEADPVQFQLIKSGGRYALYFYRSKEAGGGKVYKGWRGWTINGKEITSEVGVRLFTENGEVFFSWQNDKPTKMTRIE